MRQEEEALVQGSADPSIPKNTGSGNSGGYLVAGTEQETEYRLGVEFGGSSQE